VIPYFVSVYIMVAATCVRRKWLGPVIVLGAVTVIAEWYLARLSGLDDATLRGPYIGALVLMSVAAMVAWLHITGLERAIDLAQQQEDERERLFIELEKGARMEALGRLAGGIAHDFNNLLLVVQSSANLARDHVADRPGALEELEQIEEATQRAAKLTSQLLAFSRRQVVLTEDVQLGQILRDFKPLLKRLLGSQMQLSLDVHDEEARVVLSVSQLEQVIMNLVVNARDASDKSGSVEIAMTTQNISDDKGADLARGKYATISVTDHGSGIPAEVMDHLFEPFFTTKESTGGTGLGLATSFGIVHQMGGGITVETEVGAGTTFHIFIPLAESSKSKN
jgi:signal transduction histidine kinase